MSDRIGVVLTRLTPHLLISADPLEIRALIEDLYDGAQDDLLDALRSAQDAAIAWSVTDRRARAHIVRLHEKHGIGRQFGGYWLLRQSDIDHHPPDQKYRQKIGL